ncbi:protein FREE1-like isoform X2 [Andrographis paniculata]|uniref:protein FREE1-like isoform X2 n=1 Tax=Andrographis paniculata TaxID=175694 RepID=UPI0021E749AB|nr:protein FREE1-like isoform X2 [Andrographis paniculata]
MQNPDYTSPVYYQMQNYPQLYSSNPNPNPDTNEALNHAPPYYASAPPYSPSGHTPYSPSPADFTTAYSSSYPSFNPTPEPVPTVPSYSQPQSSYPLSQFEVHGPSSQAQGQFPVQSSSYNRSYDEPAPNYTPNPDPSLVPHNSRYPSIHPPSQYPQLNSNLFDSPYDNRDASLSRSRSDSRSEFYGKPAESGGYSAYENESIYGSNEGVYAYRGNTEPYGARGTAPKSSSWSGFDDFGRPIGHPSSTAGNEKPVNSGLKVVRAVPKADTQQDAKSGVQKFRVKLLAESAGQNTMDVLCQAIDSSIFAFWSKSSVDLEPRRIRLKSNSYTTNTILDTVTAVIIQYKEMSGRIRPSENPSVTQQPTERKKGFVDFVNLIKPVIEEKDHWVPDEAISKCTACGVDFNAFVRRHHCRNCGDIFCNKCSQGRTALTADEDAPVVRVCDRCLTEVSRRLRIAKDTASRSTVIETHEDLTKKLQEEMERSCKVSSGTRSDNSGKRMKEVACPTCTVHLQVQLPSSGSETIECGVCQHPFLVTGH